MSADTRTAFAELLPTGVRPGMTELERVTEERDYYRRLADVLVAELDDCLQRGTA